MHYSSKSVVTVTLLLHLMQSVYGNMLAFRNLFMVRGPVEGTDKKGHALVVEELGLAGDRIHGIPVYAYWSSKDNHISPYLGFGWRLPLAEAMIVPLDGNRFEMRRPDGGVELIVRDPKDRNKLYGRKYWHGEIQGSEIRIHTPKDCRHGQSELVFRNGRLVRIKDGPLDVALVYSGRYLEKVISAGKNLLYFSRAKKDESVWLVHFGHEDTIRLDIDWAIIPNHSGKKMSVKALFAISKINGGRKHISYSIDKKGNGIIQTQDTRIVWNAKNRKILTKDEWTYEVKNPQPAWNNAPIRRFNQKGEAEGEYYDILTGIQEKETGHSKNVMRLFTSGILMGKARWSEHYYKGKLLFRGEYSYDENGDLVHIRSIRKDLFSKAGKNEVTETWCAPNGHALRTRKNGDDSTVQEWIYNPEGRLVAVICNDKIISEFVGNAEEFVKWHRARQTDKTIPVPKVIEKRFDLPDQRYRQDSTMSILIEE